MRGFVFLVRRRKRNAVKDHLGDIYLTSDSWNCFILLASAPFSTSCMSHFQITDFPVCGHGSPPPDSGEAVRLPLAFRFSYVGAGRRRWFVGLRLSRLFPSFPPALRSAGECGFFRAIPPQSFASIAMGTHGSRAGQDSPCAPLPCRQGSPGEGKCKEPAPFPPPLPEYVRASLAPTPGRQRGQSQQGKRCG